MNITKEEVVAASRQNNIPIIYGQWLEVTDNKVTGACPLCQLAIAKLGKEPLVNTNIIDFELMDKLLDLPEGYSLRFVIGYDETYSYVSDNESEAKLDGIKLREDLGYEAREANDPNHNPFE